MVFKEWARAVPVKNKENIKRSRVDDDETDRDNESSSRMDEVENGKGNSADLEVGGAIGLSVNIKDLCEIAMLKLVEKSERVNEGNRVLSEKALNAITDCTSVMAKLADSVSRLDKTIRERGAKRRSKTKPGTHP